MAPRCESRKNCVLKKRFFRKSGFVGSPRLHGEAGADLTQEESRAPVGVTLLKSGLKGLRADILGDDINRRF